MTIGTGTRLHPRDREPADHSDRPWRVEYDLAYDGGGTRWTGYYRTRLGARIAAFIEYHVLSWGGSATLYQNGPPT